MAKKVGSVYAEIRAKLDKLEKDMAKAQGVAVSGTRKMQRTYDSLNFKSATNSLLTFQRTIMGVFAGMAAGRGIGGLLKTASDLEEVSNKFDVVFRGSLEKAAGTVNMLTDSYAMSQREAMQYMASVQDILVPMGIAREKAADLATEVVKLSADLGSFNNTPTAQVMEDIQSALVGNYETMKKYGVVLNDTIAKDRAVALGFANTREEVTYAAKAYAAFTLMVDSSADAIGDMERTADSAANRWKQFQANIEDFSASLGKLILPTLNAVLGELNKSLKELNLILNSPQAKFASLGERYVELQREKQKMLQTIKDAEETVGNRYQQFLNRGNLDYAMKRLEAINAEIAEIEIKADTIYPKAIKDTGESKVGEINKVSLTKDDFKKVTDEVEKSAKRANDEIKKLQDEVAKLEEAYKDAVAFSGDDSAYERMQAQLRSGAQISQMEAERLRYAEEEANKAFEAENERIMERVRAYEKANQQIIDDEKRKQEILKDTANIMAQNFSDAFADMITGTQSVEKAFTAMVNSIISSLIRMSTQKGFEQIFGMLMTGLPSLFGGGAANLPINQPGFPGAATFHSGGLVGASGGAVRNIPMGAFSFAPRLHNGLMPDEYPAVLQKGERVIPRGGGQSNNITINIAAPNGRVDRESISAMRAGLFAELNRQAMRNS